MVTDTHYHLALNELAKLHSLPPEQKLNTIFRITTLYEQNITNWYKNEVKKKRRLSILLLLAILIIMVAIGSIQILKLPFINDVDTKLLFTQISLGLLTLAVLLFTADRAFRITGGWMNYINTMIVIETRHAEFIAEWIKNDGTQHQQPTEHYRQATEIAAAFINAIHLAQLQETQSWSTQLTESIKQLDSLMIKKQQEKNGN
ncbi:SLATT domain-containing protein [Raoultella sp. RIT712]|uniref:SLATT domain-containing protein n=1 Tax=Raoultella sp. RIT712 TaxID=2666191 RepID=UPI0012ADE0F0|nr:SLATT domain-containing protein [Raoultella sp. RIT712]MRT48413.1 SLATT domain-containing protein [Raoultella sp. RIT712]